MGLLSHLRKLMSDSRDSVKEIKILFLGLDNAGKTTILKWMAAQDAMDITETQDFNVITVETDGFKVVSWDLGGQKKIRPYWRNYYENTDLVVYVVDSADRARFQETELVLQDLVAEEKLLGVPLLVYVNKKDLSRSVPNGDITELLQMTGIRDRPWQVQHCSGLTGEGLQDGLKWIARTVFRPQGDK